MVNADCDEEIMRFNTRNSPLPSDTIVALEIVQNTGEVFIHTVNGLASYVSDAQKSAADLDNMTPLRAFDLLRNLKEEVGADQ